MRRTGTGMTGTTTRSSRVRAARFTHSYGAIPRLFGFLHTCAQSTAGNRRYPEAQSHRNARTNIHTHTHIPLPCRPVPFTHARRVAGKDATQGEACLLLRALRRDLGSASPIYDTALRALPLEQGQVLQWCVRTRRRLPSCARARADAPCARPAGSPLSTPHPRCRLRGSRCSAAPRTMRRTPCSAPRFWRARARAGRSLCSCGSIRGSCALAHLNQKIARFRARARARARARGQLQNSIVF